MTTGLNNAARRVARTVSLLAGLIALATLAACVSGDSGSDGQVAGIEGTGIVSGFGSVYIDGTEFDTDNATILFVGNEVSESKLSVGDLVSVSGTLDASGRAHAQRIVYERTLDGPIDSIKTDGDRGTLVALGQTVQFDGDTVFVNTPADELVAGDLIAVSGFAQGSNRVIAESIRQSETDFAPNNSVLEIEGTVDTIDGTRLTVGSQVIDFTNAQIHPGRDTLKPGSRIEAFGTRDADRDEPLIASQVNIETLKQAPEGRQILVGARIRSYNSLSDFVAGGWRIDASDAQRLGDASAMVANGAHISVRGVFANGRVKARTLRVEPPSNAVLQGAVEAVDTDADTVALLGRTVRLADDTHYIDRTPPTVPALRIGTLLPDELVRLHIYSTDEPPVARSLERLNDDNANSARAAGSVGEIQRAGAGATLVVAGVSARTRRDITQYYGADGNEIDAETFFGRATVGSRVALQGPQNGSQISIVREARLLGDDA